jgi:hypothetical protein
MAVGSVLVPPRRGAAASRYSAPRVRVATRRETFELPRRQRVLMTVAGCAAAATIVLQAFGLATLI